MTAAADTPATPGPGTAGAETVHVAAAQYRLRHPSADGAGRTTGALLERLGLVPIADIRARRSPATAAVDHRAR